MASKMFLNTALVAAIVTGLVLSSCNHAVAESELHGRWIAMGDLASLDFNGGKFTKTEADVTWSGTYVTDGGYVTFHRTGFSSERMPFRLNSPELVIGEMTYYKDMPSLPADLEGYWMGFPSINSNGFTRNLEFEKSKPMRGSKWVLEGEHSWQMLYRGEQTMRSTPFPGLGTVEMKITHINGFGLRAFTQYQLPLDIVEYFGWEVISPPEEGEAFRGWWFSIDEARALFVSAANRAGGNLAHVRQILEAMDDMLSRFVYEPTIYRYTIERNVDAYDKYGGVMKGVDLLTLSDPYGNVWTYYKLEGLYVGGGSSGNLKMWELGKNDPFGR